MNLSSTDFWKMGQFEFWSKYQGMFGDNKDAGHIPLTRAELEEMKKWRN